MRKLHTLFGLYKWLFSPVRLYGDSNGGDPGGTDDGGWSPPATTLGEVHSQSQKDRATNSYDGKSGVFNTETRYDVAYNASIEAEVDAWDVEQQNIAMHSWDAAISAFDGLERMNSFVDSTTTLSATGNWSVTNNAFSKDYSGLSTVDATTGLSGYYNEFSAWANDVFGIDLGTLDAHIGVNGEEIGALGEFFADIADTFMEVSMADATSINSVAWAGVMTLLSPPTSLLGQLGTISMAVSTYADVQYAHGNMTKSEYTSIKATTMIGSAFLATVGLMQNLAAIKSMSNYVNTETKVMMYAVTVGMYGLQMSQLVNSLHNVGLTMGDVSEVDMMSFDNSSVVGVDDRSLQQVFDVFAQWKSDNTSSAMTIDTVQEDPFKWLAGGSLYNAKLAGDKLYTADNVHKPAMVIERDIDISAADRQSLLGSDGVYKTLEPVKMYTSDGSTGSYRNAQLTQIDRMVVKSQGMSASVNVMIDEYNDSGGKTGSVDAIDAKIAELTLYNDSITAKAEQFNLV